MENETKLDRQVGVYFTAAEHQALRVAAAKANRSMSNLVRDCVLGCVLKAPETPAEGSGE